MTTELGSRSHSLFEDGLRPRLLSRQQVAAYCGLSPSTFSNWVRLGKLPGPLPGTSRWDLKAIDAALDAMSGLSASTEQTSPLDEWRNSRARRSEGNS
jgi:predicted DNA-binding transcriptional regulator AlpA